MKTAAQNTMTTHKIHKTKGFTLIEILVALLIFAIIGILAAMSLKTIISAHRKLKIVDHHLLQLQLSMTLMRRDLLQVIDRKVRDANGDQEPAFLAHGPMDITFTRTGLVNPLNMRRQSNMQRVGYALQGDQLVRLTWDVLDEPPGAKPESQVILSGVQSLSWQFITNTGTTSEVWPPATGSNMQREMASDLPKVVLLVMRLKKEGVIQGVFPIPARGVYAQTQPTTQP